MTQNAIILQTLREASGQFVSMPALVLVSGSLNIHSRVAELRKQGHRIESNVKRVGLAKHSEYRLVEMEVAK